MANTFAISRAQVIYGLCLPLAVLVGYFLAEPLAHRSLAVLLVLLTALLFPLVVRWHHVLLVLAWNALVTPFFLPGRPHLWMLLAAVSLGVAVVNRAVDPQKKLLSSGQVSWSLLALGVIVAVTAACTGGVGMRITGSEVFGGKRYFYIWLAIAGYFALVSQRIPISRAGWLTKLFFLSGATALVSNLAYIAGAPFYFLFDLFPAGFAIDQALAESQVFQGISRITGLVWAATALICAMLAGHGLRGFFDLKKPWRLVLFVVAFGAGLLGGYRSFVIHLGLICVVAFFVEGLHRTKILPIVLLGMVVGGAALVSFTSKLPLAAQRALSFLPIDVHPLVRQSAESSTEWRLAMWRDVLPEVPRYLWKGKGYALSPTDIYMGQENAMRRFGGTGEGAAIAGDYHNGPLSVLIPFGVWGALAFLWFMIAGVRVLFLNLRYGDPALRHVNVVLLSCFVARTIFFFVFFGGLHSDLPYFVGLVGLGVSINGGVCRPARLAAESELPQAWFVPHRFARHE